MTKLHADIAFSCLLAAALTGAGCATTSAARNGQRAEQLQDYDIAVIEYTKALQKKPDDRAMRQALERAKLRSAQDHYTRGRRLASVGKIDEALVEFQLAAELNPGSKEIEDAVRETRTQLKTRIAVAREGKTQLETLIERSRSQVPPGLDLPDVKMPSSLIFRSAPPRDVYTAITRMTDLNVVFDPDLRDQPLVTIDLRNATLADALNSVASSSRTFYRVTGQRTLTVIPDTPAKRREYEEEIVRTFYLSNADLKETVDLLRIVIDARRVATLAGTNAITIKDTPERVEAAARVINAIDKARPEVIIDVELLEVDRTRLREYGLQIASPGSPGIDGQVNINREGMTLRDLRTLTQSDVFLTNLPGLFYRLLKRDQNTRILANPQLRAMEGMAAQAKFGERVPVPVTTFSPIAQGGVAQQPITSFNYETIGVNIDLRPRTHHDDEVSLEVKVSVSSISGSGFGGLPTFGNREINTVIRLRDGETNILAGLIRDDERRVMEGIPGLSDIPVIGRIFARNRKETQETDIVLTLTPRIIRVLDLNDVDLQAFRVGRDAGAAAGSVLDIPVLPAPVLLPPQPPNVTPPAPAPSPAPAPPAQGAPQPAQPIQPPLPR